MNAQIRRGTVLRNMREDDRIFLSIGGREIGCVFIARSPYDAKVKVGFAFDTDVEIGPKPSAERQEAEP